MKKIFELAERELVFFPELGIGHYPVPVDRPYDEHYFHRYQQYAATPMGIALTSSRVELVSRHYRGPLVDVGIGAGQFVEAMPWASGYDVNPAGIAWLNEHNKFHDIYSTPSPALTFWDALEHIDEPEKIIAQATEWVFISIPIFDNAEHILKSRHYRKDEHVFYFTHAGIIRWFEQSGFSCAEHNTIESELGRDSIGSYAFRRL